MLAFFNGKFVPEEQGTISIFDRSFCLGDGLFEVVPVYNGKSFLWDKHFARLQAGAEFLKIKIPFAPDAIAAFAEQLLRENQMQKGMLRVQLSRGVGARGYSAKGANSPPLVMTTHLATQPPSEIRIVTSSIRIPANDPLSKFKTCSKLSHVIARMEADDKSADEALLLNTDGNVAEATSSNFFWMDDDTVCTTPLESGALPGVTRAFVLELCRELKIATVERNISPDLLPKVNAAFLTSSGSGVREVIQIDEKKMSRAPIAQLLRAAYLKYAESPD